MIKIVEKYHKQIKLVLMGIIIFTYMFRDLKCIDYGKMYMENIVNIRNFVGIIMLIIIVINIMVKKYNMKTIMLIIFSLMFTFLLSVKTELLDFAYDFDLFFCALLVIACEDIDYNLMLRMVFIYFVIASIAILLRTLLHDIRFTVDVAADVAADSIRVRIPIGYGSGNSVIIAHVFNYISLYYIYIRKDRIKLHEIIILFALNCVMFYLLNARASYAYVNLLLLASLFLKHKKDDIAYKLAFKYLSFACVVFAAMCSIALPLLYNSENPFFYFFNNLLSGRLQLGHEAIIPSNITLLGHFIDFGTFNGVYNVVDSSYLRFLITYGIIPFIFLILFMLYFAYLINKRKDIYLLLIFIVMQMRFITELDLFPLMRYNYFFFIWSYYNSIYSKSNIIVGDRSNLIRSN